MQQVNLTKQGLKFDKKDQNYWTIIMNYCQSEQRLLINDVTEKVASNKIVIDSEKIVPNQFWRRNSHSL